VSEKKGKASIKGRGIGMRSFCEVQIGMILTTLVKLNRKQIAGKGTQSPSRGERLSQRHIESQEQEKQERKQR
jgi:hypothetical protein